MEMIMPQRATNTEPPRDDLEELSKTLVSLRKAVRANSPILRSVASSRLYALFSLGIGVAAAAFCIAERAAERAAPGVGLGIWSWLFLGLIVAAGGAAKVIITSRLAARQGGLNFRSIMRAIYGGKASTLLASSSITVFALAVALIAGGHPWLIVPLVTIYTALASHAFDLLIDLPEYRVMGWTGLAAGIAALFMVESDPLLWTAIASSAVFIVFGAAGLAFAAAREGRERGGRR
jgi:hypothetical protein